MPDSGKAVVAEPVDGRPGYGEAEECHHVGSEELRGAGEDICDISQPDKAVLLDGQVVNDIGGHSGEYGNGDADDDISPVVFQRVDQVHGCSGIGVVSKLVARVGAQISRSSLAGQYWRSCGQIRM